MRLHKVLGALLALVLWSSIATPGPVETIALSGGQSLDAWSIGGYAGLGNTADYAWWYGCSPTSAGMMMGYYDRNGYNTKTYANLVPGGVAESTTYSGSPLLVTSSIASSGHVSDFYSGGYLATGDDVVPPTHSFNCLADYMRTSMSNYGGYNNVNGSTTFYYFSDGSPTPVSDLYGAGFAYYDLDGACGIYRYLNYRGYQQTNPSTETNVFTQYIDTVKPGVGFTLAQYKTEIDAGRPVLIQLDGHTMCGIGYDSTVSTQIYVSDTWTGGLHAMTWGGTYGGMAHTGVTVVRFDGVGAADDAAGGTCVSAYDNDGFGGVGSSVGLSGPALAATMTVSSFDGGGDGWLSLKYFYSDAELVTAGILDESLLRMYWWNGSQWKFDGTGVFYLGSPAGVLGDFGVDTGSNYAWINVSHASQWALAQGLAIPEPATVALLLAGLLCVRRQRG